MYDLCCNEDGALSISPRKYIDKMVVTYKQHFGTKLSTKVLSLLEKEDHPEIDNFEFLNDDDVQVYQLLVGAMPWAISIGCFDISTAVMTMRSFRA